MSPLQIWALIWGSALVLFILITLTDQALWRAQLRFARRRREALAIHRLRREMQRNEKKGALL